MTPEEEQRLLAQARGRGAEAERALEALCDGLRTPVARVCARLLRDPTEAEDAVQDTLLAIVRGLPTFGGRSRVTTWAYRIAIRTALRIRARRRPPPLQHDPPVPPPSDPLERSELRDVLERALEALPTEQRLVLSLAAHDGLSRDEIADVLGIPVGTVWSRLHLARRRVAKSLSTYQSST